MTSFYQIWLIVTNHGYAAVVEFIVETGDQIVTHLFTIIVIKAGVLHVGWRIVKRVRNRKTPAMTSAVSATQAKPHAHHKKKVGKATK